MTRQHKAGAKPSQAHGNEDILRAKAEEANRKRRERKARQEAEEAKRVEAEEEAKRAEEAKKAEEKPKTSSANLGKKIKVIADGQEFTTLNDALRAMEPVVWANENDFRRSCWTKINRGLKTKGEYTLMNHKFALPQV